VRFARAMFKSGRRAAFVFLGARPTWQRQIDLGCLWSERNIRCSV